MQTMASDASKFYGRVNKADVAFETLRQLAINCHIQIVKRVSARPTLQPYSLDENRFSKKLVATASM